MTVQYLIKKAKKYIDDFNEEKFKDAYEFAKEAHSDQRRKSGDPYIVHPLHTANILMDFHVDEDTLIASLLHDVPEDTKRTLKEIEKKFGKKVAFLVQGITKLSKVYYRHEMEERQIESLRKLLVHCAKDIRVILIKLADRLHNMRTLKHIPQREKRLRIATESFEIYVPIANLLGMAEIKVEMEDLCFKYLYPSIYKEVAANIEKEKEKLKKILKNTIKIARNNLKKEKINARVEGRIKNIYSIYQKIKNTNRSFPDIEDILALRIITQKKEDCYRILGIIHSLFKPKHWKVQDYIALPKINGYQSLHTTVFGISGISTEFQIRTHNMHLEAEYGIAARYFYEQEKRRGKTVEESVQNKAWWIQKILALQKELKSNKEFIDNLKLDIFKDRIFIFTPKGDVVDLPKEATPIDFAYFIHTDIGHKAVRAEVNGISTNLTSPLKSGDTIKIVTDSQRKGPSRVWLHFVQTTLAKNKIKAWFKKESREEKFNLGKAFLQKELEKMGKDLGNELTNRKVKKILNRFNQKSMDDIFIMIAEGALDPKIVVKSLYSANESKQIIGAVLKTHSGEPSETHYDVGIKIKAKDRIGVIKDILKIISDLNINLLKSTIITDFKTGIAQISVRIEIKNYDELSKVFERLEASDDIIEVHRALSRRIIFFMIWSGLTIVIWGMHPFLMKYFFSYFKLHSIFAYIGIFMLFLLILILKRIARKSFPLKKYESYFWLVSFILLTIATFTVLAEALIFELDFNWIIIFGLIMVIYAYLTAEYIEYKQSIYR